MAAVHVFSVIPKANDVLLVEGAVDGVPVAAKGWTSWTRLFWTEQPPAPEVTDDMPAHARESVMKAHREACAAVRRPMTQQELREYCELLLREAVGGIEVESLHVEPLLDRAEG